MMHNTGIKSGSAETASGALSVTRPQPVWMTLDEARERAFTGEIVFEVDPEVLAYLDHGVVYYAERTSDAPLGRRLLESGVVDTGQLERGTVRVGDVEHLGRLFDRDASVDRDAVLVVTETSTADLIAELANQAVTTVRVTAYRHHPSGVHRWFVAPLDPTATLRPIAQVAQLDSTVIDDLPGLAISTIAGAEELSIEWDELTDLPSNGHSSDSFELIMFDPFRDGELDTDPQPEPEMLDLSFDMATFTDTPVDSTPVDSTPVDSTPVDSTPVEETSVDDMTDFEFQVVWPNGSEEPATVVREAVDTDVDTAVDENPAFIQTDDGELRFEMPALELVDDDVAADEVPDDVAAAVRRAIAAIESASIETASIAPMDIEEPTVDVFDGVVIDTFDNHLDTGLDTGLDIDVSAEITSQITTTPVSPAEVPEPAAVSVGAFAPPTMEMSAEAIYAREAAALEAGDVVFAGAPFLPESSQAPALSNQGIASVVFVDDEPADDSGDSNERSSALRRLIGSLRRKDH